MIRYEIKNPRDLGGDENDRAYEDRIWQDARENDDDAEGDYFFRTALYPMTGGRFLFVVRYKKEEYGALEEYLDRYSLAAHQAWIFGPAGCRHAHRDYYHHGNGHWYVDQVYHTTDRSQYALRASARVPTPGDSYWFWLLGPGEDAPAPNVDRLTDRRDRTVVDRCGDTIALAYPKVGDWELVGAMFPNLVVSDLPDVKVAVGGLSGVRQVMDFWRPDRYQIANVCVGLDQLTACAVVTAGNSEDPWEIVIWDLDH